MTQLRFILLALAVTVFAAIGWRMSVAPVDRQRVAHTTAEQPPATPTAPSAPSSPAPVASSTRQPEAAQPAASAAPAVSVAPKGPSGPALPPEPVQPPAPEAPPTPAPTAAPSAPAMDGSHTTVATPPVGPAMTAAEANRAIEERLRGAPDLAHVFDVIRTEFPTAAERTMGVATEALRNSGTVISPDDLIAAAMRELALNSGVLAAHAGPDALGAIFEAKAATLADLEAADPRICADYLYGGTSPEFSDFVASHRALVARTALATIAAMADGRNRRVNWDVPSADDYKLIEKGLAAKGLSAPEIAALLDGKSLEPTPSDTRLCDNMRAYLDVMRTMPAEARNRIYGLAAELLARS